MPVTMRDVARKADVSIKTVSRVVNDQGEISEATRQRVLAVIQEMGYRPNLVARGLVTQRTYTVGLVVGDITNPFFPEVARGVQDAAQAKGYNVFLCNSDDNQHQERRVLDSLAAQSADGIIIFPTYTGDTQLSAFADHYRPIVAINHFVEHPNIGLVMVDNLRGANLAVDYLVGKGHTEIGMLTGDTPPHASRRTQGFQDALTAHGLPLVNDRILYSPPTLKSGYENALRLLTRNPSITAIFTYNDLLALGAIQACQDLGRCIPDDCAIVGFDDILLASMVTPALTTIRTDKYELGHQALLRLLVMLDHSETAFDPIQLDVDLVIREST